MHRYHQSSSTMFFANLNKNAVTCWNTESPLRPSNIGEVARDNITLIYPTDLDVSRAFFLRSRNGMKEGNSNNSFPFLLLVLLWRFPFRLSTMICGCCPIEWFAIYIQNWTVTTSISAFSAHRWRKPLREQNVKRIGLANEARGEESRLN